MKVEEIARLVGGRVEGDAGVLEDHPHIAPAEVAQLLRGHAKNVSPATEHRAADEAPRPWPESPDRQRGRRLHASGFADDARVTLLPGERAVITVRHTRALDSAALSAPAVLRSAKQLVAP